MIVKDKCIKCGSNDSWNYVSAQSKVCACGARKQLNFQTDTWESPSKVPKE